MPATIEIHLFTGITGFPNVIARTDTGGTEVRFKRAADFAANLSGAITIPSEGSNYSWRQLTKLFVSTGLKTEIKNFRWYAEPAPDDWDGVTLYISTLEDYVQPVASNESALLTSPVAALDADIVPSTSPYGIPGHVTSAGPGTQYSDFDYIQPYVVTQVGVNSTATSSVRTARTIGYRYNES